MSVNMGLSIYHVFSGKKSRTDFINLLNYCDWRTAENLIPFNYPILLKLSHVIDFINGLYYTAALPFKSFIANERQSSDRFHK